MPTSALTADPTFLAELRSAALDAVRVLRSVMAAAIAPTRDGRPTNPSQARLAASQLLRLAHDFLPVTAAPTPSPTHALASPPPASPPALPTPRPIPPSLARTLTRLNIGGNLLPTPSLP